MYYTYTAPPPSVRKTYQITQYGIQYVRIHSFVFHIKLHPFPSIRIHFAYYCFSRVRQLTGVTKVRFSDVYLRIKVDSRYSIDPYGLVDQGGNHISRYNSSSPVAGDTFPNSSQSAIPCDVSALQDTHGFDTCSRSSRWRVHPPAPRESSVMSTSKRGEMEARPGYI
jgi:hypothetical protein